jgi:hypothetical protein
VQDIKSRVILATSKLCYWVFTVELSMHLDITSLWFIPENCKYSVTVKKVFTLTQGTKSSNKVTIVTYHISIHLRGQ